MFDACERALTEVLRFEGPADVALRSFFRVESRLGRRDRGVVADTVFDVLRHRRRYAHLAQSLRGPLPARLVLLSWALRLGFAALRARGLRLAGTPLSEDDLDCLHRACIIAPETLPQPVRLSLPDWLFETLARDLQALGEGPERLERLATSLLAPAALDLRVNLLKADRDAVCRALAAAGIKANPLPREATAVRIQNRPALENLPAFEQGWFEVQDLGSQCLVSFAAPRRGQTVVDFCAGAGGKSLALAALMRSTGQIYACDVSARRLQRLKPRLARSGATNIQPLVLEHERDARLKRLRGRADLVLVDAPCSGTGTLRRNPEIKWRLRPEAIDELVAKQAAILEAAAALVKPAGALVYATCSLLARENDDRVRAFGEAHPEFGTPQILRLWPDEDGSDGFFAARWVRVPKVASEKA